MYFAQTSIEVGVKMAVENISIHWIPFELENSEIWKKDQAGKY